MTTPVAVTFDWYGTLADHRLGIGRGRGFREYLALQELSGNPWDRRVLYEVFDYYARAYRPELSDFEKWSFWTEFTRLLFERTKVNCSPDEIGGHAHAISEIFGSRYFQLFADVNETLSALKTSALRMGLISNWHGGLGYFCEELGIAPYFDAVVSSAEVGCEKPDPRIFREALTRLGTSPGQTLHVGDSIDDDFRGAKAAGLDSLLIDRRNAHGGFSGRKVSDLHELKGILL
ncbi:MAG: HAD family hydrolase [Gemmatimonadaceae bacterium]